LQEETLFLLPYRYGTPSPLNYFSTGDKQPY
jgi:hypothetical protein